jgi:hypothetical protein
MKNSASGIRYQPGAEPRVSKRTAAIVFAGAAALVTVMIAFVR